MREQPLIPENSLIAGRSMNGFPDIQTCLNLREYPCKANRRDHGYGYGAWGERRE